MKFSAVILLMAAVFRADGNVSPRPGDVVYETNFKTPAEQQAWAS